MRFSKRQHYRQHGHRQPSTRSPLPHSAAANDPDVNIRKKIQSFAYQPRFSKHLDAALGQFFGQEALRKREIVADEGEIAEFQEWMFNDFLLPSGETILDIFRREMGPQLSPIERELLDAQHRWNRYRLFEVEEVMPGVGIVAVDLLSGETWEIHDRSASRSLQRWIILLGRPSYTDRLHFAGGIVVLPPTKKQAVVAYSRQLLATFLAKRPGATLDDFYRQHGLDIRQFIHQKGEERPIMITPEGHPLEHCEARYLVKSAQAVMERLGDAEEFNFAGPADDQPGAYLFNWLLRGRSHVPEEARPPEEEALVFTNEWIPPDDEQARFRTLGDVILWPGRLELICFSRPRLQAGKLLLESLAGDLVRHRSDHFEAFGEMVAREQAKAPPSQPRRRSRPDPHLEAMDRRIFEETFKTWPDQPVPALDGKTPREAVRSPDGRAKVIEMLKVLEYHQTKARRSGEKWYDINLIRRDLGLPES